jgi:hypothetical protein
MGRISSRAQFKNGVKRKGLRSMKLQRTIHVAMVGGFLVLAASFAQAADFYAIGGIGRL